MNQTLVHIAAPSSLHDDCRYRAQADAILQTFYHDRKENVHDENSLPHDPPLAPARLAPDSFDSPVSVIPESPLLGKRPSQSPAPNTANKRHCPQDSDSQADTQGHEIQPPLTIHPSPPPIASTPFTTHITPTLSLLANRLNLARTFVPAHQARPLHVLERGYWRLRLRLHDPVGSGLNTRYPRPSGRGWNARGFGANTSTITTGASADANNATRAGAGAGAGADPNTWDRELFTRFWAFLSDIIAKEGRAGWGVWCILERESEAGSERKFESGAADRDLFPDRGHDHRPTPHPPDNATTTTNPSAGNFVLKVYTWGEVAPHVYLLLYLASERGIRGMGAQWRDASERVVIQMA